MVEVALIVAPVLFGHVEVAVEVIGSGGRVSSSFSFL
jgi:hypothetical protein